MSVLGEIFSRTSDAVFAIDHTRRIVYRNQAFADIFRRGAAEFPRRKCYEVICGRTLEGKNFCNPDCPVGKSLLKGQPVENFDLAVSRDDGQSLWLSVGAIPASRVFDKTAAIFTLRPIRVSGIPLHPDRDNRPDTDVALTRRERQILDLLAQGLDARTLARHLHIKYVTARNHIQHIYEKLGVHNRAEAVSYAIRRTPPR